MIKFDKVYVKFINDFYSLFDCCFEIKSNTFIIEKNPCGSMALFSTISKINKQYTGEIFVDNINLKNIKDKELNLAFLPFKPVLFKHKSVKFNLTYPLKIRKLSKQDIQSKTDELLSKFNLEFLSKKTKNLTISEQKIVVLLRTLIREPKYVILENFFEDLDADFYDLATQIIDDLKEKSIVIASESNKENFAFFKNFNIIEI